MNTFEPGKTYSTRLITDSSQEATIEVISRTAKTLKANTNFGPKTLRIFMWRDIEHVRPWGSYSMCPIISADRIVTNH